MGLVDPCRAFWIDALRIPPRSLRETILWELQTYYHLARDVVLERCRVASGNIAAAWRRADPRQPAAVDAFYRQPLDYAFELLWWHSFGPRDRTFLSLLPGALAAYRHGARRVLDFGGGVGSHALVLAAMGYEVTLADISGELLDLAEWRARIRTRPVRIVHLDRQRLEDVYDVIVAADVLEHLTAPANTLMELCRRLRHGGFLFVSMPRGPSSYVPQHISFWGEQLIVDSGLRMLMRFPGDAVFMRKTGDVRAHGAPPRFAPATLPRVRRQLIPSISPGLWWQQMVRWHGILRGDPIGGAR